MYDLNKIKECINTDYMGQTVIQFDELKSTYTKAKNIFDKCPNGAIVLSENQYECKIRFGRKWISNPEKNIYFSIILKYNNDYKMSQFEAISCASVQEAIKNLCNINCQIKWPNDIMINDKKISSIACEEVKIKNKLEGSIITVAINANDCSIDENDENNISNESNETEINDELYLKELKESKELKELKEYSTSIKSETKNEVDREMLISYILNKFENFYDDMINYNNIDDAVNICNLNSSIIGRDILIRKHKKKSVRKVSALSVDSDGDLLTINENGNEEIINSGEVTVKYVKQEG